MNRSHTRGHRQTTADGAPSCAPLGGAVIGDNWVCIALAHADPLSREVLPLRVKHAFFTAEEGEEPSAAVIGRAIERCVNAFGGAEDLGLTHFALCLPPRLTLSRTATSATSTHPDGPFRKQHSVVTREHLSLLEARIGKDGFWPRYAVADMIPLSYRIDNANRTLNPCGEAAHRVEMRAHVVLTQHDTARTILDCLKALDIRVDVLMSPFTAMAGHLAAEECTAETVAIDIDRLTTSCAFFDQGRLVHTEWIPGGSYGVLAGAARKLGRTPEDLAVWLNDRTAPPPRPALGGEMELPLCLDWKTGTTSLVDLDLAARRAAADISTRIVAAVRAAEKTLSLRPRRAVLTGDDSLTLQALTSNLYQQGLVCVTRAGHNPASETTRHLAVPGMSRLLGMMKSARDTSVAHPFLAAYHSAPALLRPREARTPVLAAPRAAPARPQAPLRAPHAARRPRLTAALAQLLF